MAEAAIPLNQQDALPLQTITAATAPDTYRVIGGAVIKYWTALIGGAAIDLGGGHIGLVTPFLDLSGCRNGVALLTGFDTGAWSGAGAQNPQFMMQYRTTPVIPCFAEAGSINLEQAGIIAIGAAVWAAAAAGATQRALISWGPSSYPMPVGTDLSPATIGGDIRFFVSFSTNAQPATRTFNLSLWASS